MAIFRGVGGAVGSTTSAVISEATEAAQTATEKAAEAAASASNAATSKINAATSASNALSSATSAATSAAIYDDFLDRYLGAKTTAPTTDNDGNPLQVGALYYSENNEELLVWSGSAWVSPLVSPAIRDSFAGDGSTVAFTLSRDPSTEANTQVYINGIYQNKSTYSVSGTTLTLSTAPEDGDSIEVMSQKSTSVLMADTDNATYTASGAGAVTRTLNEKLGDTVSVKDFGAVGDGVTDDTQAIQAAIDFISLNKKGSLFIPSGVYSVTGLTLKSYVILKGEIQSDGWGVIPDYVAGSVLKLADNANTDMIRVASPSYNWGLVNLVLDGNKDNQSRGSHILAHYDSSGQKSTGGLIEGCKFVEAKDWSIYLCNAHPTNISNNAIIHGLYMANCADMLITANSISSRNNDHPSVWFASTTTSTLSDNLIWRAEAVTDKRVLNATVDTANDYLVVTSTAGFYDGMPVYLRTTDTYPTMFVEGGTREIDGISDFVVTVVSNTELAVWARNKDSSDARITFTDVGVGTHTLESGPDSILFTNESKRLRILGNRVAGSPSSATYMWSTDGSIYSNNYHWGLNYNEDSVCSALYIYGSEQNIISDNVIGEFPSDGAATNIDFGILIDDFNNNGREDVSRGNVIADNVYNTVDQAYINDQSSALYAERNIISGLQNLFTAGDTSRIISETYRSEPNNLYYFANAVASQSVASGTNVNIDWESSIEGNPANLIDGSTIVVKNSQDSLLNVKGKMGFSNRPDADFYVLIFVIINDNTGTTNHRIVQEVYASSAEPSYLIIPFDVSQVIRGGSANVTIRAFQTSGSTLNVNNGADFTQLCISKVSDFTP